MTRRANDEDEPTFQRIRKRPRRTIAPPPPQRLSTYFFSDHGPDPVPEWVITEDAAVQRELGLLKTGKEADVYLVERQLGARRNLLAAKRYRSQDLRDFQDDSLYRDRQRTGNRRTDLAMAQNTSKGRTFRAALWLDNEFSMLSRLWQCGVPVPYPVQTKGNEILLEYIGDDTECAPRLADTRMERPELEDLAHQTLSAIKRMAAIGVVHGDLSPYNTLVWNGRLQIIDLPQALHIQDPDGSMLLARDIRNILGWFTKRGVDLNLDAIVRELCGRG